MCHLSPREVNELGWFDLVGFTLQIDDENAEARRQIAQRNAQSGAPSSLQQMSTRL